MNRKQICLGFLADKGLQSDRVFYKKVTSLELIQSFNHIRHNKQLHMKKTILTTLAVSCFAITAQSATISLNFVRSSNGATALASGDVAGVSAEDNWNNAPLATANNHSGLALTDGDGIVTTATAGWVSGSASWSTGVAGTGSVANMAMMTGYLDQGGDGNGQK